MAERTSATRWEVVVRDETGAMVNIDYICPHCHFATGNFISIGANDISKIDDDWETDQRCEICGEDVTIECR